MTDHLLLQVEGLGRRYGGNQVVEAVDFTLARGQILGFLGPNGAGKSTTLRMLAGVLAPDAGRIVVNGFDLIDQPRQAKQALGYLPEQAPLYRELTVDEQLYYSARLHRLDRAASGPAVAGVKQRCGLLDVGRRLIGNLSRGYRQRVGIAQALLHDPPLLILDEPTSGLDLIQARELRTLIRELGREHGVILSTHLLADVQAACTHVQIMRGGRLAYTSALADLHQQQHPSRRLRIGLRAPPPDAELARLPTVSRIETMGDGRYRLHHTAGAALTDALIEQAHAGEWGLWEMTPEPAGLEQRFVELLLEREITT
jgi:ABC-2 type transport system ATP-binding protein